MARRGYSTYTKLGKRMVALSGGQQRALAQVLNISQQSISKKLKGNSAIQVSDLEKLSSHYDVPMSYFFGDGSMPPELRVACARAEGNDGVFRGMVIELSIMPEEWLQKIDQFIRAMHLSLARRAGVREGMRRASELGRGRAKSPSG